MEKKDNRTEKLFKRWSRNVKIFYEMSELIKIIFSPCDVLRGGFSYIAGLEEITDGDCLKRHEDDFKSYFGSTSTQISFLWYDVITISDIGVKAKNRSEKGFKRFLIALHFLWAYPKNAAILASTFSVSKRTVEGDNLWHWIRIIPGLRKYKIVWPEDLYNDPDGRIFLVSVDGVDFKVTENRKYATLPLDKGEYSQNFNHGALKYEIAIDCYEQKIIWINGPFRGGEHDKVIYDKAFLKKFQQENLLFRI